MLLASRGSRLRTVPFRRGVLPRLAGKERKDIAGDARRSGCDVELRSRRQQHRDVARERGELQLREQVLLEDGARDVETLRLGVRAEDADDSLRIDSRVERRLLREIS